MISLIITISLASIAVGYVAGYLYGRDRGRDEGWLDRYFEAVKADRERRDAAGRFARKAKP